MVPDNRLSGTRILKKMASKRHATALDDLPQETTCEILLRLPVKALIRSTSVNKKWYSLISNPNFISDQIKHASSHSHDNAVFIVPPVISQDKHCSLISLETSKIIEKYEVPFTTKTNSLKLINSLDGLMLFTDSHMFDNSRDLFLWNPCLKTHKTLVSSCFENIFANHWSHYKCLVGLGYNSSAADYRVVRIVYAVDTKFKLFGDVAPRVEVYSLRKHTWKEIQDPVVPRVTFLNEGTYSNGSFYWLETNVNQKERDLWILSFDFENEVVGELKVPKQAYNCIGLPALFRLMEYEGSLALCVFDPTSSFEVVSHPYCIWLMRQENGVISWILRFSATLIEHRWSPINITRRGTILMETSSKLPGIRGILACNLKTMHYKDLGFRMCVDAEDPLLNLESCTVDASFTESLVMYDGGKSFLKFAS